MLSEFCAPRMKFLQWLAKNLQLHLAQFVFLFVFSLKAPRLAVVIDVNPPLKVFQATPILRVLELD